MNQSLERVVNLLNPALTCIYNMTVEAALERLLANKADAVREIDGSFALVAQAGKRVRLARSMDRPMRYFLAKRKDGPALIVADRIDTIYAWLKSEGLEAQFHPSYTRMVPAHYVVEIQLIGCPDPAPTYQRFFTPLRNALSTDLEEIGGAYVNALADEISKWLGQVPQSEPIGVSFSGGIDSGAVFLTTYHVMQKLGLSPARLKAFTLTFGEGPDLHQARSFLDKVGLALFHESIEADVDSLNGAEAVRVVEDYKSLDIECAAMSITLGRGIRQRYPHWKYMLDGDGGDENLKDYPLEANSELTIRSVVNNLMLYQEGWGVGNHKHSLTYSGGLSRSYARTYAPMRLHGFESFSPFTRPSVIGVAESIPFERLTDMSVDRLYALKGEIVRRGIKALTGLDMPVFEKRRFQHGALTQDQLRLRLPEKEAAYRKQFHAFYS
jgi:asparagine synthase (glutamine-hydrolysing)